MDAINASTTLSAHLQPAKEAHESLRVLVLSSIFPNPFQPIRGAYIFHQTKALSATCSVRVIAPILWTTELLQLVTKFRRIASGRRLSHGSFDVDHPRYWYSPGIFQSLHGRFFVSSVKSQFRRLVKEFQPDVIYTPWIYPDGWAAVQLGQMAGIPVVLNALGSDIMLLKRSSASFAPSLEALSGAERVATVSQSLANRVEELGIDRERISVVYNGIDKTAFRPGNKAEARIKLGIDAAKTVLISAGNLLDVKGFDLLLGACARINSQLLNWQLHLFGDGKQRPQLLELASKLGISDRVVFHGAVSQQVLAAWMQAADLYVLSSRSEGIPNVLMESIACDLPYVATDVGGVRELDEFGGGIVVPPLSSEELHAGIVAAVANPPIPCRDKLPSWEASAHSLKEVLLDASHGTVRR